MATGDILKVNNRAMTKEEKWHALKEFLRDVSEINEKVNEDTLLTSNPPINSNCKQKCAGVLWNIKECCCCCVIF